MMSWMAHIGNKYRMCDQYFANSSNTMACPHNANRRSISSFRGYRISVVTTRDASNDAVSGTTPSYSSGSCGSEKSAPDTLAAAAA